MSTVPGSVYDRYNAEEVVEMLEADGNEFMCEYSDDDLDLDVAGSDEEPEKRYTLRKFYYSY